MNMYKESFSKPLKLLPRYFFYIGICLILMSVIIAFMSIDGVIPVEREAGELISGNGILLALTMMAFSRDGVEDELTSLIRLRSFSFAFLFGVFLVIFNTIVNLVFEHKFEMEYGVYYLLFSMYAMYFLYYYRMRKSR